jgi:hypothetical protein
MPDVYAEAMKLLGTGVTGSMVGGSGAYFVKAREARARARKMVDDLWSRHKQRHLAPCKRLPWVVVVAALFLAVGCGTVGPAKSHFPVHLSGTEPSTGHPEGDVQVDVTFEGWVGGTGAVPDTDGDGPVGRVAHPGEGGHWKIVVDHCCPSTFEARRVVSILDGSWELQFPDGRRFSGGVEMGIVRFPKDLGEDIGCGPGVAQVSAILRDADEGHEKARRANACLDDLRGLDPIPIWGTIGKLTR